MLLTRDLRHTAYHLLLKLACRNRSSFTLCGAYCNKRGSNFETIHMHSQESRGSMDSGVDVKTGLTLVPNLTNHSNNIVYEKSIQNDHKQEEYNQHLAPLRVTSGRSQMPCLYKELRKENSVNRKDKKCSQPNVVPRFHNIPTIVILGQTD